MGNRLGIIIGTSFHYSESIKGRPVQSVATPFGNADMTHLKSAAVVFRHGKEGETPAHRVRHQANLTALKDAGVRCVIGFQSVGSLKEAIPPGSLLIPHDYISLVAVPTLFESNHDPHIVPAFDEPLRASLIRLLREREISFFEQGVYWQTQGPRFETRAEIRLLAQFADCVGMTAASEATIAQEAGLAYCCVCSIDNYAHGIGSPPLTEEKFHQVVRENTEKMETILKIVLESGSELTCPS
ncbi:MAG: 6-oxopurine nucleoside phosphorylase [Deltaproteobacteria bacterium]|nr:MAG: 6-oxopurine nucleoside phosphorylase [Deltaproteobacteria bacterium]